MGNVMIRVLRQFIGYLLVATLLISPIGCFYGLCAIGAILGNQYCMRQWMALDILACTTIHNTQRRTISGYTGERLHLRRYRIQARVVDFLAMLFGDEPNHCERAYQWEKKVLGLS